MIVLHTILLLIIFTQCLLGQTNTYSTPNQDSKIPRAIKKSFSENKVDINYTPSFHLNPFYLKGDFDGDGKLDYAIMVKNKNSGKYGIAFCHTSNHKVYVVGAGNPLGARREDFGWMDAWHIYPKGVVFQGATEKSPPKLMGDALVVEKLEASSALIYWSGKEYQWYQQGD
jgi:hypothetical protein